MCIRDSEQTGQTVISGIGELHLDIIIDRLKREFKVEGDLRSEVQLNIKRLMDIGCYPVSYTHLLSNE